MKRRIRLATQICQEHMTFINGVFRVRLVYVTTVHLECGHTKDYRHSQATDHPHVYAQCKRCDDVAADLARDHFDRKRDIEAARKGGPQ